MKTYYNGPQRRQTGTPSGQKGEQSTRMLSDARNKGMIKEIPKPKAGD